MSWLISALIASLVYSSTTNAPLSLDVPPAEISTIQKNENGDETEKLEKTFQLNPNGRISISNVNGSITIEAWDKNEVKLEAIKTADSRERLSQVNIEIDSKPDSLRIETQFGYRNNGNWNCYGSCRLSVEYRLTVPRTAMLNEIETVNGSVAISDMTNYTKASAVNGTVKAINLRGTAYIETVNGTSEVSFDSLNDDSRINLTTVNGQVNLTIPSDSDATLKAESVNGRIANDFGLTVRKGKYVGRDLYGKVGDGRAKINLESVNGGLIVKRKQDGKNVKPVTNLLPAKDEDDEDVSVNVDVDENISVNINKEINEAIKISNRVAIIEAQKIAKQAPKIAAQAMKDAQRAMAESDRELQRANRDLAKLNALDRLNNLSEWNDLAGSSVEERSQSFNVSGKPDVIVNAKSCPISVRGWDKKEVMYRLVTIGNSAIKPDVDVSANQTNSQIVINATVKAKKLKAINGRYSGTLNVSKDGEIFVIPKDSVRMEVFVPRESNLKISTDKEIRVEGVSGKLDLDGEDGDISVRDSNGELKISAQDAMIRVIGFNGKVDSQAVEGTSMFEGTFDNFSATLECGSIILTLPNDSNVDIIGNTKIETEGFDLTEFKDDENNRRIGKGGINYRLNAGEGQILVRNSKTLISKY